MISRMIAVPTLPNTCRLFPITLTMIRAFRTQLTDRINMAGVQAFVLALPRRSTAFIKTCCAAAVSRNECPLQVCKILMTISYSSLRSLSRNRLPGCS